MLQKMRRTNDKGFTLIELMIVIAIIGILAAIAIPNFIAYRNKAFCSAAESDANSVAGALANWFAIPSHMTTPAPASLNLTLSGANTFALGGADVDHIIITVHDVSLRCPTDYINAQNSSVNPKGYWTGNDFVKLMQD